MLDLVALTLTLQNKAKDKLLAADVSVAVQASLLVLLWSGNGKCAALRN